MESDRPKRARSLHAFVLRIVKPQVKVCRFFVLLGLVSLAFPAEKSSAQLAREGAQAELNGDVAKAYVLYSEAAAKDPDNQLLWLHAPPLKPIAQAKLTKSEEKAKEPEV